MCFFIGHREEVHQQARTYRLDNLTLNPILSWTNKLYHFKIWLTSLFIRSQKTRAIVAVVFTARPRSSEEIMSTAPAKFPSSPVFHSQVWIRRPVCFPAPGTAQPERPTSGHAPDRCGEWLCFEYCQLVWCLGPGPCHGLVQPWHPARVRSQQLERHPKCCDSSRTIHFSRPEALR